MSNIIYNTVNLHSIEFEINAYTMGLNSSNLSSTYEIFENVGFINIVDNKSYIVVQMLGFIYTLVCVFWLVYVIYKLITLFRNRKSLINFYIAIPNRIKRFVSSCTERVSYAILYFLCFSPSSLLTA